MVSNITQVVDNGLVLHLPKTSKMKQPRLPTGTSDPVAYTCTCSASSSPASGLILLFYRYFGSPPSLPTSSLTLTSTSDLAVFHTQLTQSLNIGGKIRVSNEGFNITVGGTQDAIQEYITHCLAHWSFLGLNLTSKAQQDAFFKPSPGCACCFDKICSVRITSEITPMGVTNYVPSDWHSITYLSPAEFHAKCLAGQEKEGEEDKEEVVLLDVRNHYESRIGYFVSPRTGEKAVTPEIRRFAQWPLYVKRRLAPSLTSEDRSEVDGPRGKRRKDKAILTYCTGGIRCEKGARFLADTLAASPSTSRSPKSSRTKIYTLDGGISAYLSWFDTEIALNRKTPSDSLFKGQNYVFDARGSIGLATPPPTTPTTTSTPNTSIPPKKTQQQQQQQPISTCHICTTPTAHLSKCASKNCHLILVVCASCEKGDPASSSPSLSAPPSPPLPRCCKSCEAMDLALQSATAAAPPIPTSTSTSTSTSTPTSTSTFTPPTYITSVRTPATPPTSLNEKTKHIHIPRPMCDCERERERSLWGDDSFGRRMVKPKTQLKGVKNVSGRRGQGQGQGDGDGDRTGKGREIPSAFGGVDGIDIRIKTID